jgi:hypothetical protein
MKDVDVSEKNAKVDSGAALVEIIMENLRVTNEINREYISMLEKVLTLTTNVKTAEEKLNTKVKIGQVKNMIKRM